MEYTFRNNFNDITDMSELTPPSKQIMLRGKAEGGDNSSATKIGGLIK